MKKTILEIYALAVCFFTVACLVVVCGMALWNLVEIAAPEFTITNYQFDCHQSDDAYRDCQSGNLKYTREESPVAFPEGEALTSERLSAYDSVLKAERRSALQSLVKSLLSYWSVPRFSLPTGGLRAMRGSRLAEYRPCAQERRIDGNSPSVDHLSA